MFKVLSPLKTLEGVKRPGSTVELEAEESAELLALGAVEEITAESKEEK